MQGLEYKPINSAFLLMRSRTARLFCCSNDFTKIEALQVCAFRTMSCTFTFFGISPSPYRRLGVFCFASSSGALSAITPKLVFCVTRVIRSAGILVAAEIELLTSWGVAYAATSFEPSNYSRTRSGCAVAKLLLASRNRESDLMSPMRASTCDGCSLSRREFRFCFP